ncbi:MAG TPA: hypothetical protein DCY79_07395, partial [Planctomycetaceae bacterium]|nr:hypothetical protein [Planctomycetaceae bacterium]
MIAWSWVGLPVLGQQTLRFNRDIRPILTGACFACHGPDAASRKGDLRLDLPLAADSADGVIVAGKPEASELMRRITSGDPDSKMP